MLGAGASALLISSSQERHWSTSDEVLLFQEKSSVRCTPRNLVLFTLTTGTQMSMLKSTTISLVLSAFKETLSSVAPHGQVTHFAPVICLPVADETQRSCVIRECEKEVGAVLWCAVLDS